MKISELLPIGSVVLLEGGTKRLMIFGVKQTDAATNIEYDYIGVLYPEGHLGSDSCFFFNAEQIKEVCFVGMDDEERQKFLGVLAQYYESKG